MFSDNTIRKMKKTKDLPLPGCPCENCERARRLDDPEFKPRAASISAQTIGVGGAGGTTCPSCGSLYGHSPTCNRFYTEANEMLKSVEKAERDDANPKDLAGASKPQMGLIPVAAMESVARVMELGAAKYGPYNWRSKKVKLMVYANAGLRHLFKWIGGETIDKESGQPHLAHCAACMFICLDALATGNAIDDRTWPKDLDDAGKGMK